MSTLSEVDIVERARAIRASFRTAIRDALDAFGLTQKDLAERLGVSPTMVSRTLDEEANPTVYTIAAYSCAVGLRADLQFSSDTAPRAVKNLSTEWLTEVARRERERANGEAVPNLHGPSAPSVTLSAGEFAEFLEWLRVAGEQTNDIAGAARHAALVTSALVSVTRERDQIRRELGEARAHGDASILEARKMAHKARVALARAQMNNAANDEWMCAARDSVSGLVAGSFTGNPVVDCVAGLRTALTAERERHAKMVKVLVDVISAAIEVDRHVHGGVFDRDCTPCAVLHEALHRAGEQGVLEWGDYKGWRLGSHLTRPVAKDEDTERGET